MAQQRGRNRGITGLFDITGETAFTGEVFRFEQATGTPTVTRTKRGDNWKRIRQAEPGATLAITAKVLSLAPPLPDTIKGAVGSITLTYHENRKSVVPVVVTSAVTSLAPSEEDRWNVAVTCQVTGPPVYTGWSRPPTTVNPDVPYNAAETHLGVTKAIDPDGIADADARTYDLEGLVDSDQGEVLRITQLIATAIATRDGMKLRLATFTRTDRYGGTLAVNFARTTTEEDIVNEGTATTIDPHGLASEASSVGVSAPPQAPMAPGLVKRTTTTREINDGKTATADAYGTRDTVDDHEMPGTFTRTDPLGLDSAGKETVVFDTGAATPTATVPSGLQHTATTVREENQTKSIVVHETEVLNSEQKRTFPKIRTTDDALNISDDAIRAEFWTVGATPPALPSDAPTHNVKLVTFTDFPIAPTRNMRVWLYGPKNSRDELVLPNYETLTDASGLASTAIRAGLDGDTISDPAGYSHRDTKTVPVTLDLGVNRTLTVKIYGLRTRQQDIEFLQSKAVAEAGQLERHPVVVRVTDSSTPDDTGLNPDAANLSLYWSISHQETATGKWVHAFEYRPLTATEAMIAQFEQDEADPASLNDENTRVAIDGNATPPAAPVLAGKTHDGTTSERVGKAKYRHVFHYSFRTSAQKLVAERTETLTDTSGLESSAVTAAVWLVSGGAPVAPTLAGFELRDSRDVEVPNPLYRLRLYRWGLRTTKQDIEYLKTIDTAEAGNIARKSVFARVTASPTPDATGLNPDAANLSLYSSDSNRLTSGSYVHFFEFRPFTALEERAARREVTEIDPSNLNDATVRVLTNTTSTPDAVPVVAGRVHYRTTVERIGKARYEYVYYYRYRTNEQQIEADRAKLVTDVSDLNTEQETADVYELAAAPADPAPPTVGLTLIDRTDLSTPNPLYGLRVYRWGKLTTKEKIEHEGSEAVYRWLEEGLVEVTTVIDCAEADTNNSLALAAYNTLKSDAGFEEVGVRKLHKTKAVKRVRERNTYRIIKADMIGGKVPVSSRLNGATVQVWVEQIIRRGQTLWEVLIGTPSMTVQRMDFFLERRVVAAKAPMFFALTGTRNESEFLGLPAGSVTLIGADPYSNLSIASPRGIVMRWKLRYDSSGQYDENGIQTGWVTTNADMSGVTEKSWVDASALGWTSPQPLPGADYAPLLTV